MPQNQMSERICCPPETSKERVEQLYDLVLLMMVDGEIHEKELAVCRLFALRLGFDHVIIEKLIETMIDSINGEIEAEMTLSMLMSR